MVIRIVHKFTSIQAKRIANVTFETGHIRVSTLGTNHAEQVSKNTEGSGTAKNHFKTMIEYFPWLRKDDE
jgi:hypothetical protein